MNREEKQPGCSLYVLDTGSQTMLIPTASLPIADPGEMLSPDPVYTTSKLRIEQTAA